MNEDENWALDCHDTSLAIWNLLGDLLTRCMDNKDCPADIPEEISDIMNRINEFSWCDKICKDADRIL